MTPPSGWARARRGLFLTALGVWAAGLVLGEGLAQAGAMGCLAVALSLLPGSSIAPDVRRFTVVALGLAAWQAVSPALALARGLVQSWPASLRYGQWLDTLAPASLAVATTLGVPWLAVGVGLAVGWALNVGVGAYQHFYRWPFGQPSFLKTPVDRVRESFEVEGPERFAAGGLLFHRLRFAHGAVAVLGPALALLSRRDAKPRVRAAAAVTSALLIWGIYMSFARAALLASLLLLLLCALWLGRGWLRRAAAASLVLVVLVVCLSPSWRLRFVKAEENLIGGERRLAMSMGVRIIRQHPFLGVGFGNHRPAALAAGRDTAINPFLATDSHNLWLTVWAETGLVGLVLVTLYHGLLARALWQRSAAGSFPATGALLSLAGFHLLSLVHYLPYHSGVYLSFAFVWGLGLAPWRGAGGEVHRQ